MNKQQLANKIWASANKMRSKIDANEYKDYILGLIFYKFLSDNEVAHLKHSGWTDEDLPDLVEDYEDQDMALTSMYMRVSSLLFKLDLANLERILLHRRKHSKNLSNLSRIFQRTAHRTMTCLAMSMSI